MATSLHQVMHQRESKWVWFCSLRIGSPVLLCDPAPGLAVACLNLEGAAALPVKGLRGRIREGRPFASPVLRLVVVLRSEKVALGALFC